MIHRILLLLGTALTLAACDSGSMKDRSAADGGQKTKQAGSVVAAPSPAGQSSTARVALVMGNNQYTNLPDTKQLASPVADATDVAAALKGLGYTLVTGKAVTDAGKDAMLTATESFAQEARNAEAAVFYFSGHGVQVGEDNYLLPSDVPTLTGMSVLKNRTVLLRDAVMVALEEAGVRNKAIILDCCRDNPFAAQLELALAQVGKNIRTKSVGEITGYGPGFYLAFATSPGFTAEDGNGERNSPFTAAMLKSLPGGAGKDIDFFFRDVKLLLGQEQVSWTNHSLNSSFALARATVAREEAKLAAAPAMSESEIKRQIAEGVAAELARRQAMAPAPPAAITPPSSPPLTSTPSTSPLPSTSSTSTTEPKAGATMTVSLPGGEKMVFCYCPPGTFTMGSPASEEDRSEDEAQVPVRISKGYWMARTEVTQGQWEAVMGSNPSYFKGSKDLPVEKVSWEEVQAFIAKLNGLVSVPGGLKLTLPTEAQWEYACRAGTESAFAYGDTLTSVQANFDGENPYGSTKKGVYLGKTVKVGSYAASAWGLQDMHGNVYEWCLDAWDGNSKYIGGTDRVGTAGSYRVVRGGSWLLSGRFCRSAFRVRSEPGFRGSGLGFRLASVPAER